MSADMAVERDKRIVNCFRARLPQQAHPIAADVLHTPFASQAVERADDLLLRIAGPDKSRADEVKIDGHIDRAADRGQFGEHGVLAGLSGCRHCSSLRTR